MLMSLIPLQTTETIKFSYVRPIDTEQYCVVSNGDYCLLENYENDYPIFLDKLEKIKAEREKARIEAEKREAERLEAERLAALPKTVNFDAVFNFIDLTAIDLQTRQSYVDAGYVLKDYLDYFHHNTSGFMKLFNSIKKGDTVVIGGKTYEAIAFHNGVVSEDGCFIYLDDGTDAYRDDYVQIITCNGGLGTKKRFV